MPRVDFYLLEQTTPEACLQTTCRIISKAYKQQHHLLVLCKDKTEAVALDNLLWTFQEISFVPHILWQNKASIETPIIISDITQSLPPHEGDILVNLTFSVPDFFLRFQRVVEIVSADSNARQCARERFRTYRDQGAQLHSHQIK